MDRRDAMKAFGTLASSAGLTVVPVTTKDAAEAQLVILKVRGHLRADARERLAVYWKQAVSETTLQNVRTIVIDDELDIEIVRKYS